MSLKFAIRKQPTNKCLTPQQ